MAQKNKAHVKARTSKPTASKTAPRPSKTKTAAKAGVKKPVAASSSHARKPISVKPVAKAPVAKTSAVSKAPEAKKPVAPAVKPAVAKAPVAPARPAGTVPVSPARAAAALAKSGGQKLTAPVQPSTPKDIAEKTAAARQIMAAQKKSVSQRHGFKTNEFIVYPAHGVGRIVGIEEQEIAGMSLELFVITFDKEKLTLRVPTGKLESVGMRKLADDGIVKKAMDTLKGRARVKRTMWSRRAQEYVAKINSGDLVSIAEVVRDLYRSEAQPEQSYSERQLYEDALDRMAREIAAVEKLDERGAVQRITDVLSKSARGRRLAEGTDSADMRAA
jgi:CarD family transcriptional regulator